MVEVCHPLLLFAQALLNFLAQAVLSESFVPNDINLSDDPNSSDPFRACDLLISTVSSSRRARYDYYWAEYGRQELLHPTMRTDRYHVCPSLLASCLISTACLKGANRFVRAS